MERDLCGTLPKNNALARLIHHRPTERPIHLWAQQVERELRGTLPKNNALAPLIYHRPTESPIHLARGRVKAAGPRKLLVRRLPFQQQLHNAYDRINNRPHRHQHNQPEYDCFFLLFPRVLEQELVARVMESPRLVIVRRPITPPLTKARLKEIIR